MKFLKFLLSLTVTCVFNYLVWIGLACIVILICNKIIPIETIEPITKGHLTGAYSIGTFIGFLWWIIIKPFNELIYELFRNWKKERTVRLTFDDGGDVEESLSNSRGREELN